MPPKPAGSAAPRDPCQDGAATELGLQFTGRTGPYFRLWISNLALTVLSLGLLSGWAKVRAEQYLYAHTLLDGSPFEFRGLAWPILRGRLLLAILVGTWLLVHSIVPEWHWAVLLVAGLLLPWVMAQSLAFRICHTAYRGISFGFAANAGHLYALFLRWIPRLGLSLGASVPWFEAALCRWIASHTHYGQFFAEYRGDGRCFFEARAKSIWFAAAGTLPLVVLGALGIPEIHGWTLRLAVLMLVGCFALFFGAAITAHHQNLRWRWLVLGGLFFRSRLTPLGMLGLYLTNCLAIVGSLGLLVPWAVIRTLRYRMNHLSVYQQGGAAQFQGETDPGVGAVPRTGSLS